MRSFVFIAAITELAFFKLVNYTGQLVEAIMAMRFVVFVHLKGAGTDCAIFSGSHRD